MTEVYDAWWMPLGRGFSLICNRETGGNVVPCHGELVVNSFSIKQAKNNTVENVCFCQTVCFLNILLNRC